MPTVSSVGSITTPPSFVDRPQVFHVNGLKNGDDKTLNVTPGNDLATAFVTVPGKDVKAHVTDESIATVKAEKLGTTQDGKSTRYKISWSNPELDSGWNGATVKFSGKGYHASVAIGMNVDD